jgi:hypothetical protein
VPLALSIEAKPRDPVIVVSLNGETRAYPLTIIAAHGVVNDQLGGVPIAVTYCRICSESVWKFGFCGFSLCLKYDSSVGCGLNQAVAEQPLLSARRSAIRVI